MSFVKRHKSLFLSIAALLLGLVIGIILLNTINTAYQTKVVDIISPIQNVYINIICYLALPLLFFFLITSIYNMGDLKSLGKIGLRTIGQFVLIMFVFSFLSAILSSFIFGLKFGSQKADLESTLALFKNFIPQNIWTPFIKRNVLQVNLMAILLGVTLLVIGKDAKWLIDIMSKVNKFLLKVFSYISVIIPLYIFISIIKIILIQDNSTIVNLWKLLGVYAILLVLLLAIYFVRSFILSKDKQVIFKALPPFIIALTSANSTLSLDKNLDVSENKLKEKKSFVEFSIPLGMMLFKPAAAMYLSVVATYFAMLNGINISFSWLLSLTITSTVLTIAIPPVNGGGINNYYILLSELSLPLTPLPILIVLDSIVEFVITGFNVLSQTMETYCLSRATHNYQEDK